jgi:hypothetical protein
VSGRVRRPGVAGPKMRRRVILTLLKVTKAP